MQYPSLEATLLGLTESTLFAFADIASSPRTHQSISFEWMYVAIQFCPVILIEAMRPQLEQKQQEQKQIRKTNADIPYWWTSTAAGVVSNYSFMLPNGNKTKAYRLGLLRNPGNNRAMLGISDRAFPARNE
jgi:hypothetical protein